jgi:hypothetical protein
MTNEYNNTFDSVAIVEVDSLTIVGSGMNKTIIGPESENEVLDHPIGIGFVGVSAGFVSGLAVEYTDYGCFTGEGRSRLKAAVLETTDVQYRAILTAVV